jgi:mono/diheme cytochrome c family protein
MVADTRRLILLAAFCLGAGCAPAPPAPGIAPVAVPLATPDPAVTRGRVFAQEVCAGCHAVTPGAISPNPAAPRFATIARMPGMTTLALNVWLNSSHPTMPNIAVTPAEARDLSAYLQSLRRDGARG